MFKIPDERTLVEILIQDYGAVIILVLISAVFYFIFRKKVNLVTFLALTIVYFAVYFLGLYLFTPSLAKWAIRCSSDSIEYQLCNSIGGDRYIDGVLFTIVYGFYMLLNLFTLFFLKRTGKK